MNKVALLTASVALILAGCGSESSSPTSPDKPSPSTQIKAIDGYLVGAEVWVDMDDDQLLNENIDKKVGMTTTGGKFSLPEDLQDHFVFIKAKTGETVDETRGLVEKDFALGVTPGGKVINPMTNMVVEQLNQDVTLTVEQAQSKVVEALNKTGLDTTSKLIFGDYIADDSEKAQALNIIGETLVDHADKDVDIQLEIANKVAESTVDIINDDSKDLKGFSPKVDVSKDGVIEVKENNRPIHDLGDKLIAIEPIELGTAWQSYDASQHFSDADGDTMTYQLKELTHQLNGLTIDNDSGIIDGTLEQAGTFIYQVFAKDTHKAVSYPISIKVTVTSPNSAPTLDTEIESALNTEVANWYLQEGEVFNETLNIADLFTDSDGYIKVVNVEFENVVGGLTKRVDSHNLQITISGTPVSATQEQGNILISVKDDQGAPAGETATLTLPIVEEGTPVEPPKPSGIEDTYFYQLALEGFDSSNTGVSCEVRYFDSQSQQLYGHKRSLESFRGCPEVNTSLRPSENPNFESLGAYTTDDDGGFTLFMEEDGESMSVRYFAQKYNGYFVFKNAYKSNDENMNELHAAYTTADPLNQIIAQQITNGVVEDVWSEGALHFIDNEGNINHMDVDGAMNDVDSSCSGNMCEGGVSDADLHIKMSCDNVKSIYDFTADFSISDSPMMWNVQYFDNGDSCSIDFTSEANIQPGIHTLYGEVKETQQGRYEDILFSFER
ncbi:putative Ig domain-containing protein [Vibrio maerlii]|uniref:putative Ig domain-containing protein n=1 Tax=Vibrio maerlii TaxID=2231648 RepID=UPI000E3E4EDC|nr:putative Ig domain-containing protein [Vibrio maerlii]